MGGIDGRKVGARVGLLAIWPTKTGQVRRLPPSPTHNVGDFPPSACSEDGVVVSEGQTHPPRQTASGRMGHPQKSGRRGVVLLPATYFLYTYLSARISQCLAGYIATTA